MEIQTEFDLTRALADWRRQLSQSPAYRSENLEELESHLRDSVAGLGGQGLSEEEAFIIATHRIGTMRGLESEFAKVNGKEVWLNRLLWMLVGVQAWSLIGTLSAALGGTSLSLLFSEWPEWLRSFALEGTAVQTRSGGYVSVAPVVLSFAADLVALAAITAGGWWLIRRTEKRLSRLLRQPRWLALLVCGLCLALLLANTLSWLGLAWTSRLMSTVDYGQFAYARAVAGVPLFLLKTVVLAVLTLLVARRLLRRAAG